MTLILITFVLVVLVCFICALMEAVFMSVTHTYVAMQVRDNRRSGKLLEHLKENIDRPISAILTLNTISNTLGSAFLGAQVQATYGSSALTVLSVALTISILTFAEILPKILGATHWKTLAPICAYVIQLMIFILYPVVRLSEFLSSFFTKPDEAVVTREEMIMTAELGVDEGTLHSKESNIIKNLLMLNSMFVSDIMTPRSVFFALPAEMTVEEVSQKHKPIRFSRIPVYEGSLDNIVGLTHRYKILEALSADLHKTSLKEISGPIHTVPERTAVASVMDLFVKRKEHLFLAVDEYGIVTGLVTLEDAIETLLGVEIVDEFDNVTDMRQYALEQWQIRKNQIRRSWE